LCVSGFRCSKTGVRCPSTPLRQPTALYLIDWPLRNRVFRPVVQFYTCNWEERYRSEADA